MLVLFIWKRARYGVLIFLPEISQRLRVESIQSAKTKEGNREKNTKLSNLNEIAFKH